SRIAGRLRGGGGALAVRRLNEAWRQRTPLSGLRPLGLGDGGSARHGVDGGRSGPGRRVDGTARLADCCGIGRRGPLCGAPPRVHRRYARGRGGTARADEYLMDPPPVKGAEGGVRPATVFLLGVR